MSRRRYWNRIIVLFFAVFMFLGLCVPSSAKEWKFDHSITIVCPWGLNGGADSTIRPMSALLEDYLGVPVEVRNETGESGVVGATYAYKQPADGYTFLLGTQSLYVQDLMGQMDFSFKDKCCLRPAGGSPSRRGNPDILSE